MTPKKDQIQALNKIKTWFNCNKNKRSDYMILSGYAGTGKSTLLCWLQDELNLGNDDIIFTSFTGKATNVLIQNGLRAKTLHRLLYKSKFNKKTGTYYSTLRFEGLDECLVVVDEASMLSKKLFDDLINIYGNFKVLFVGDDAQLPPINSELNVMKNPDIRLTKVLRQAALNPIIRLATKIRNNEPWKIESVINKDMNNIGYMPVTDEVLEQSIDSLFCNDVFLCSTNKDRVGINSYIRSEVIKRSGELKHKVKSISKPKRLDVIYVNNSSYPGILHLNDRLIILDNCNKQQVFNGQMFVVSSFKKVNKHKIIVYGSEIGLDEQRTVIIHPYGFLSEKAVNRFEISKEYRLDFKKMGVSCDYAYCLTVHKSQGSEFDNVFLNLSSSDKYIWKNSYNRWLYTAITRASKNLYFVGDI